jgi:hypothetical protein
MAAAIRVAMAFALMALVDAGWAAGRYMRSAPHQSQRGPSVMPGRVLNLDCAAWGVRARQGAEAYTGF